MTPFCIKPSLIAVPVLDHVSFSNKGPLLETLEHQSQQLPNFELSMLFNIVCALFYFLQYTASA